jgi:hypothetical protein
MGRKARCRGTWRAAGSKGESDQGRALGEASEIVWRSDAGVRAKPASATLTAVHDKEGVLELSGPEGTLRLELGDAAAKWAERIKHPKTRVQKRGVKPGHKIAVVGVDDKTLADEVRAAGAEVKTRASKDLDLVFFGVDAPGDLARLSMIKAWLAQNGGVWIVRPKGSRDLPENAVRSAAHAAGLVDVKVVALSATHTADKFGIPVAARRT